MNKHFHKRRIQNKDPLRRTIIAIGLLILFLCAITAIKAIYFANYYSKITTWITERHTHLDKKVNHSKRVVAANQDDTESQIHFEFYTALPNMNVTQLNSVIKKDTKASTASTRKVEIANADELEDELSTAVKEAR